MSVPELVWVLSAFIGTCIALSSFRGATGPQIRLKNGIRTTCSGLLLINGLASSFNPPPANPTWLSVFTPIVIALAVSGMALLSVIDEQSQHHEPTH
jgi:hypothetical protein